MKIVVTGAAGNLGGHVMHQLVAAGHEATGLDRHQGNFPGRSCLVDLQNAGDTTAAIAGAEVVVHLANHAARSRRVPDPVLRENVAMNFNVFEAARLAGVRLIVFASSIQAMRGERLPGDPVVSSTLPWLPLDGDIPAHPSNPYALSKVLGEVMLRYQVRHSEATGVALRLPYLLAQPPPATGRLIWKDLAVDEAFAWLTYADGARLILALLAAPLRGFHIYLPAAPRPLVEGNVEELRQRFFPRVPLKTPAPLTSFVDCSVLQRETGWTPRDA